MREMKDSGIEWIGAIPQDWKTDRLQWHLKEINVSNNPIQTKNILSLTIEAGVIPYAEKGNQGNKAKEDYSQYKIAFPDTLVINSMNVIIGAVGISQYFGCVSPVYYVFEPIEGTDLRYIYYLFTNTGFQKEMRKYAKGILEIRLRISSNDMLKRIVPSPSFKEQQRIADYLDKMCAEIDAVLEKTRASIEEYKKLKQAVITQAVTKGIRGDRPMKDSGIEWIGDIPAEWSVVKGRRLILATQNGLTRRDLEKSEGFIVLKLKNLDADGNIDYSEVNRVALTDEEKSKYQLCDGDFLFVRVNGSRNLVGKCAIYHDVGEIVAYNDHIIRVKLNDLCLKEYFHYYLLSIAGKREIELHTSTAAGQFTISGDGLRELLVVLPGIVEQAETVAYLDKKSAGIDALIAKKRQHLTEIENYKKSLIYEYVTGKKEVHPL